MYACLNIYVCMCVQKGICMSLHTYALCIWVFVYVTVCGKQKDIPLIGGDLSQHTHA